MVDCIFLIEHDLTSGMLLRIQDRPYLSDNIRLGVGARGSNFVFTKIPEEDTASSGYKLALESTPLTQNQVSIGTLISVSNLQLYLCFVEPVLLKALIVCFKI